MQTILIAIMRPLAKLSTFIPVVPRVERICSTVGYNRRDDGELKFTAISHRKLCEDQNDSSYGSLPDTVDIIFDQATPNNPTTGLLLHSLTMPQILAVIPPAKVLFLAKRSPSSSHNVVLHMIALTSGTTR